MAAEGDEQKPAEREVGWREELRANVRVFGLIIRSAPLKASLFALGTVIKGVMPAIIVWQTGRFLTALPGAVEGGLGSAAGTDATRALVTAAVAVAIGQLIDPVTNAISFGLGRHYQQYLARRVIEGVTAIPGIAHFEDPKFRDQIEVVHWLEWSPFEGLWVTAQLVQMAVQIVALTAVVALFAGWAPALLLVTIAPAGVALFRRVKVSGIALWQDTPEIRRASYFRSLAVDLEPAKELRLFGLRDWVLDRNQTHWLGGMRKTWHERRKSAVIVIVLRFLAIGGLSFTYLSMVAAARDGRIDVGAFAASAMGAVQMVTAVISVFTSAAWMRRMNYLLPQVLRLFDIAKVDPRLDASGTRPARGGERSSLRFEGVRFRYPGTERWILDGVDLEIPDGRSIALVGENGAGKTTLIKLLCRFYDPTEGRITLDGVDIREYDLDDYRTRIACIFQDFVRYELSARDNVGFGAVHRRGDDALLAEAAGRVGVLTEIESLPQGWETPLSRAFEGVDLSGGQWQRIALARAIFAQLGQGSDILVLDEPTASLDVRLEHELYEHFTEMTQGRTTLLVSHRFSTVRMAERIVFLEHGKVIEEGSHDELIARGGGYANLYHLQAAHYRQTGVLE